MEPFAGGLVRRVLVVEDEALTRTLIADALQRAGFDVQACGDAETAAAAFRAFDPDAVVCDIDLGPGESGLDLLQALTTAAPHLAALVLSNYAVPPSRHRDLPQAIQLDKRSAASPDALVRALETALTEHDAAAGFAPPPDGLAGLTPTQFEVLALIAAGLSNAQIAARRRTTVRAIERVNQRIFDALGIPTDTAVNPRVLAARRYLSAVGFSGEPA